MITSEFTGDGSTGWLQVEDVGGVHISVKGTWGGGSLAIEQRVNGNVYTIQTSDDSLVVHTNNFNRHVSFEKHDIFRLTLSSSITPTIDYSIAGRVGWVLS